MSEEDTQMNVKGLEQILKALKMNPAPVCRVGILGNHNSRSGKASSNATVGAAHEFGTTTIPQRSFLRIPVAEHLQKRLEQAHAFDEKTLQKVIKTGDLRPWLKKVGTEAEAIVQDAFATGGFGKWAPHAQGYTNQTGRLLIDTQQLRESISSEVK